MTNSEKYKDLSASQIEVKFTMRICELCACHEHNNCCGFNCEKALANFLEREAD